MRKSGNPLSYFLVGLLLLLVSSMGCAHRGTGTAASSSPEVSLISGDDLPDSGEARGAEHNRAETSASAFNQTRSNQGTDEGGSLRDEFDIFSDEKTEKVAAKVADPFEDLNRAMFLFNDKLYFWLLKPISRGYKAVVPTPVRKGVRNFFHNITAPVRVVSALLQGKGRAASAELTGFLINSTVGVLGFGDPAKSWPELSPSEEDLGQTLATYGIGDGFYIVWPVLGPSTLRDSVGMVGDWFLDPVWYVEPFESYLTLWAVENVNDTSFRIGDYESLKEAAIDPYTAIRNAYIQNRKKKIKE
jgi:phospholipid-binding lipoprotein MlaA